MEKTRLGRTNLYVTRTSFGALPIQRVALPEAVRLLRKAYDCGINFFDTARAYSDSEEKLGAALADVREHIIIATKSHAKNAQEFTDHLNTSLRNLKTEYVDILQLHNPATIPGPDSQDEVYSAAKKAQQRGDIRFLGVTNHRLAVAREAVTSGLFDTLQFPFSSLSSDEDIALVEECKAHDVGFIAMKALSGGLITKAATTFAFLRQYENVVPIWGIQREDELDEFIELDQNPPELAAMLPIIEQDRQELVGSFCRGCGYCMPCPVDIPISLAARISLLLARSPSQRFLEEAWQQQMERINDCLDCGQCKAQCPYELDTPTLLRTELQRYRNILKEQRL